MRAFPPVWWSAWVLPLLLLGCAAEPGPEGYQSPGKPRPPVALRLSEAPRMQAGVPVRLRLELILPAGAESHSIEFDHSPALQVTGIAPGTGGRLEAAVMPTIDSPEVLAGFVAFRIGGTLQGSPFRLRLPVGQDMAPATASIPAPAGVLRQDSVDGTVMSLTAETTSR